MGAIAMKLKNSLFMLAEIAGVLLGTSAANAALVTDLTVFSSNSEGHNWNGLLWNTQGHDTDPVDHYKLYVSSSPFAAVTPTFINGYNDIRTQVSIPLVLGSQTFSIYGEGVNTTFDPLQYFELNLYFDGNQSAPSISGVQNLTNTGLAAAGSWNGLGIFGGSGNAEAGTLSFVSGNELISLTDFNWITNGNRDVVWSTWANDAPYSGGSGTLDYFGSFTITVQTVPEPATGVMLCLGLVGLGLSHRWHRRLTQKLA
jgi:hypothetical protein